MVYSWKCTWNVVCETAVGRKSVMKSGAHASKDIWIEFHIWLKYTSLLYFLLHLLNHNEILHIRRQLYCLRVYKIYLWLDQYSIIYINL